MLYIWRPWPHPPSHYSLFFMKSSCDPPFPAASAAEEVSALFQTCDHNTLKYTGFMPKRPGEICNLWLYHLFTWHSISASVFLLSLSLSLCFPCSFARKCFFICFVWLRRETRGESLQPWVGERIQSQLACRSPVMSKRDKMKVCSVRHVPQPWEALWRKDDL